MNINCAAWECITFIGSTVPQGGIGTFQAPARVRNNQAIATPWTLISLPYLNTRVGLSFFNCIVVRLLSATFVTSIPLS